MSVVYYPIEPVPAPRQSRADVWLKRPCVLRYRDFRDAVARAGVVVPQPFAHMLFFLPMPITWSGKKRQAHLCAPHETRPDADNLCKALLDAVYGSDAHVHDVRITKRWGVCGGIYIADHSMDVTTTALRQGIRIDLRASALAAL